jgi:hypothetical protein
MPKVTDIADVLKPFADVWTRLEPGNFHPEHTVFYFLGDKPGIKARHFKEAFEMHKLLVETDAANREAAQELMKDVNRPVTVSPALSAPYGIQDVPSRSDTPNEPPHIVVSEHPDAESGLVQSLIRDRDDPTGDNRA